MNFADALGQLLADHSDEPIDELISALEIQLDGLREQQRTANGNE